MASYRSTRIVPTILTVIIIIVVIVGLVSLARVIFTAGGGSSTTSSETVAARDALLDTTAGSSVVMSVRGPIVADENFRSYQIAVSPNTREIQTFKGYLDTVIDKQSLPNNTAAYDEFVHALDKANLTSGRQLDDERNDIRGICASGRIYEFKVMKSGESKQTLWTSTCNGSTGSLKANATQLTRLFLNQIPDSNKLISDLKI